MRVLVARAILAALAVLAAYGLATVRVATQGAESIWGYESPVPLWVLFGQALLIGGGVIGGLALFAWAVMNAGKSLDNSDKN